MTWVSILSPSVYLCVFLFTIFGHFCIAPKGLKYNLEAGIPKRMAAEVMAGSVGSRMWGWGLREEESLSSRKPLTHLLTCFSKRLRLRTQHFAHIEEHFAHIACAMICKLLTHNLTHDLGSNDRSTFLETIFDKLPHWWSKPRISPGTNFGVPNTSKEKPVSIETAQNSPQLKEEKAK